MNLLERYIFRRTLTLSLMTLSATTVMVLITQVLIYVNLLTASGQALITFFTLSATLIPPMLNLVMPFALHIGATQTLNGMNTDSELAVIEAAGGSPFIQTKPIILLAVIMSLVALALSHFVEPFAYKHKRDIIARAGADLVRLAVQSGTFQEIEPNLFVQIADQLPSGDFAGIFIADSRKPDTDLVYYAKRGAIHQDGDAEVLVLADGEVQRKNSQTGDLSVISFASYMLDFNQFGPSSGGINYSPKERSTAFLLFAPRTDDFFTRNEPKDIRAEINRRFSEWLYPLVFGTIAIYFAVGARSNRQERLWSLTAGIAVALAVRGAGFFLVNVSGVNSLYAFLNFAVPGRLHPAVLDADPHEQVAALLAGLGRTRRRNRRRRHALVDQFPLRRQRAAVARRRRPAMIGHTLFLYFFRRYVATFVQFFLGVSVISYLVDFTEFSRFKSTLPGYTLGRRAAGVGAAHPADRADRDSLHHPVFGDRHADGAQPPLRTRGRPLCRRFGMAVPGAAVPGEHADRHARRHRLQPARGACAGVGATAGSLVFRRGAEQFRRAHSVAAAARPEWRDDHRSQEHRPARPAAQ